jgi:hypothetical protein
VMGHIHDTIWAAAFERIVWNQTENGRISDQTIRVATEYANEVVKMYGQAIMAGLPVRR